MAPVYDYSYLHPFLAEGVDYTGGPYSVNFTTAANDRQCINIPLAEDNESESPETFVVRLDLPVPGNDDVIAGSPDMTTVTILGMHIHNFPCNDNYIAHNLRSVNGNFHVRCLSVCRNTRCNVILLAMTILLHSS